MLRDIHNYILFEIENNHDFKYTYNDNLTKNYIPTSLLNYGFTCFFNKPDYSSINSDNAITLIFSIQFFLDIRKSNYLDVIEDTMKSIIALREVDFFSLGITKTKIDWQNFNFKRDKDWIRITYPNLRFEYYIKNK